MLLIKKTKSIWWVTTKKKLSNWNLSLSSKVESRKLYVNITYGTTEDNLRHIVDWWTWNPRSRTASHGAVVGDLVATLWGRAFGSHQVPLVRTAEEFQTGRNSCPVLQSVFGFQISWLMMDFNLNILTKSTTTYKKQLVLYCNSWYAQWKFLFMWSFINPFLVVQKTNAVNFGLCNCFCFRSHVTHKMMELFICNLFTILKLHHQLWPYATNSKYLCNYCLFPWSDLASRIEELQILIQFYSHCYAVFAWIMRFPKAPKFLNSIRNNYGDIHKMCKPLTGPCYQGKKLPWLHNNTFWNYCQSRMVKCHSSEHATMNYAHRKIFFEIVKCNDPTLLIIDYC